VAYDWFTSFSGNVNRCSKRGIIEECCLTSCTRKFLKDNYCAPESTEPKMYVICNLTKYYDCSVINNYKEISVVGSIINYWIKLTSDGIDKTSITITLTIIKLVIDSCNNI
jgi:hypothetical protein